MKRIIAALSLICLFVVPSMAQSNSVMPLLAGDTITNTGTVTKVMPSITGGYAGVVFQPVVTKISGTAAGTGVLYESMDGTNYKSTGDTLTLANVTTNTIVIKKIHPNPVWYKWIFTGSGTESAVVRFNYVYRKTATN